MRRGRVLRKVTSRATLALEGIEMSAIRTASEVLADAKRIAIELLSFRRFTSKEGHSVSALSSFALGIVMLELVRLQWGATPISLDLPK